MRLHFTGLVSDADLFFMKILKLKDREYHQLSSSLTKEEFSRSVVLSTPLGSKDFFIHHEIIAPGKRSSSPHYHSQTDEFIYVLKGCPIVIEDSKEKTLLPGDCVLFEANCQQLHFVKNNSEEDIEILVINKKLPVSDVQYHQLHLPKHSPLPHE